MNLSVAPGVYPMLYSYFKDDGSLRLEVFQHQVDIAIEHGATGIAILGLATEVSQLTPDERIQVLEIVASQVNNQVPLLVTVFGDTPVEQVSFSQRAVDLGANGLILQPPSQQISEPELFDFFGDVFSSVNCAIGIQNAPEFLTNSLCNSKLIELAEEHNNFEIAKLECSAVALEPVAKALKGRVMVFNGRCGLELPDNLRAGAQGIIPSIECIDKTTEIYQAHIAGDVETADRLYMELLPTISFLMQGIPHLLTYGKMLAAKRMKIEVGGSRDPSLVPTQFGLECMTRLVDSLADLRN